MLVITSQNIQKNQSTENQYNNIESRKITYKTEELLEASKNRFKITIKVAERAKRRKYEDVDIIEDPLIKPVIRAIIEMADEITRPEIISD